MTRRRPRPKRTTRSSGGRRPAPVGPPQVGRRPSNPLYLAVIAVAWIACGVIALLRLHASWRLVPGVVFIGVGLLFLRGAAATVVRRDDAATRRPRR